MASGYWSLTPETGVRIPLEPPYRNKMPYIKQEDRMLLDLEIDQLIKVLEEGNWTPGEVNYTFYRILVAWFKKTPRYKTICSIMGTLTCVSHEFYRKVAGPYEDEAEKKNGEIT